MSSGLVSGGPVSLVYGFLRSPHLSPTVLNKSDQMVVAIVGSMATAASLGEMVSMYPTAGGQYHFIAKFAPKNWQNILSWFVGWIGTFGWVSFTASAPYLAAGMTQGLVVLTCEAYQPQRWHLSMIYWALVGLATALNLWGSRLFSLVETASLIIHLMGFAVVLIVMFVTNHLVNPNTHPDSPSLGYDGAIHLCEEMANPETAVPYCMLGSLAINDILGFIFLLTILFCMGDMESALETPTSYPIIEIFRSVTGSLAGSCALTAVLIIAAWLGTIALLASTARMVLSLARDRALPFSGYLSQLDARTDLPKRAITTTSCLLILFGLINIASTTAFNAILSLAVLGLHISYLVPIVFFLWRRLVAPHNLNYGPWKLGRAGIAINVTAIIYLLFTSIFMVFPSYQPVTPSNMNYASLIFGFVWLMSVVFWLVRGRKEYKGPAGL
ncbi:hypothetical protein AbraIFM66951_009592 [Aspergillus brasiliensis]|nr:hypothetical protein AbraIFM66951_009592 [Aspergillus brasiliensis]